MFQSRTAVAYLPAFLIPAAMVLICVFIAFSSFMQQDGEGWLARGLTFDLVITAPLVYFLMIRKKSISNLTVVPWIVGGIILAKALLPEHNNQPALWASQYLLPLVELVVLSLVGHRIFLLVSSFKKRGKQWDFLATIQQSTREVFGKGLAAKLLAWEIAVFYYAFFRWKKPQILATQFTYHKNSGIKPILVLLMFLVAAETFVLHLLIQLWSSVGAWILTGLSIYSFFWILAQIKAMSYRPILMENRHLKVRHGLVFECDIPLSDIKAVHRHNLKNQPGKEMSLLPDLNEANLLIELEQPVEVTGLYGVKLEERALKLRVDDPEHLQDFLQQRIA